MMSPHANGEQYGSKQVRGQYHVEPRLFPRSVEISLSRLQRLYSSQTSAKTYAYASAIEQKIPMYYCRALPRDKIDHELLKDEWHHALLKGPGAFVVKGMYQDSKVIDAASCAFQRIIEREASGHKGDHFAAGGKK